MHQTYQQPPPPPPMYLQPPMWYSPYCMPTQPFQNYFHQTTPMQMQQQNPPARQQNDNKRRRIYYCHTHDACFHPGFRCQNKGPNHQDNATFSNRMGGSTENVRGVNQDTNESTTTWRCGTGVSKYLNKLNNNLNLINSTVVPQTSTPHIVAKADSGTSKHYFRTEDTKCLDNVRKTNGPSVFLPNMEQIHTTHSGLLPFKELSEEAQTTNILPKLQSASLVSLGQLCDDNCEVNLNERHLYAIKK